jgi:hypothetical protein
MRRRRQRLQNNSKFPKIVLVIAGVVVLVAAISLLLYAVSFLLPKNQSHNFLDPFEKTTDVSVLKKDLNDANLFPEKVMIASEDASIVVQLEHGPTVYFSPEQNFETEVSSLQLIISRLTIEKKQPNIVDLRYDKPIVKF